MSRLKSLNGSGATWIAKDGVYHVSSPHVMLQAAGYLKYMAAKEQAVVYFRGQSAKYNNMRPGLYRGIAKDEVRLKRERLLDEYLQQIAVEKKVFRDVGEYAREGLLQHYGLRTRWIDVVDNIWIALWFSVHNGLVWGSRKQVLHFERRVPAKPDDYCYIVLMKAQVTNIKKDKPGLYLGPGTEVIDLRLAAPSTYIRPHSQHGLLMRRSDVNAAKDMNYDGLIAGVLRMDLKDALAWLGDGKLLTTHSLFPPPVYDFGYQHLINGAPDGNADIGSVQVVGA